MLPMELIYQLRAIMAVKFDQIVLLGRSRREYKLMFSLSLADLARGLLDFGGGPASFTAEISAAVLNGVAVDPILAQAPMENLSQIW